MVDPLRRLSTTVRLWAGAALCVVPLGLTWQVSAGLLLSGTTLYGDCGYTEYPYCTPDTYLPGSYVPGDEILGSQTPARVFLLFAIAALAVAAVRLRTQATRQLARAATASVAIAGLLAARDRATLALVCAVLALVLTVPVVWNRRILAPGRACS